MAQWVKGLAAKTDDPSSIPRTHMVEEEDQLQQVVLCPPHVCCGEVHASPQPTPCKERKTEIAQVCT